MVVNELINDEVKDDIIDITDYLVKKHGAHNVNVSKILNEMKITNRVFYNRFHNIDEVLRIVYENSVYSMRESFNSKHNIETDLFAYIMDVASNVLVNTYEVKKNFSQYMFEHDSLTEKNFLWWMAEIKKIIQYGIEKKMIKNIDMDAFCYSLWCYCRGFNVDVLNRGISKEDALVYFQKGFGYFIDGIKENK